MLTKLTIRNFKRFREVEIELGNPVVFVGPNNSGKTSAMQALALWDIGVKRWNEKRSRQDEKKPERRYGVTINRKDLLAIPHPRAILLWHDLHVRDISKAGGKQRTDNVRIEIIAEGVSNNESWKCGLEFDYANVESFYCRPLRIDSGSTPERMPVPEQAGSEKIAFLPPMSGLATTETRLDQGAVNVRVGEGRTAEVLRNLCYRIKKDHPEQWAGLVETIKSLFGVEINEPKYVEERGEITMDYREKSDKVLDLSSSGRGLQQTLLILAYMAANPGAVILLDEPDAHLEILRQRNIYRLLTETARTGGNQIIMATHSEVLLNEAAGKDLVIAFVGKPHRIGDQSSQVRKALAEIGFDQYYLAESTGWVLYLEGSTDLAILQTFAKRLDNKEAIKALGKPFIHYVGNQPRKAEEHFHGLREAVPNLKGIALFDRLEVDPPDNPFLPFFTWKRREIENYLCTEKILENYAQESAIREFPAGLFTQPEIERRLGAMEGAIADVTEALEKLGRKSPWDEDTKVSDNVLKPIFQNYFSRLGLPNLMEKKNFYELANYVPTEEIGSEIIEKLDEIVRVAKSARRPEDH